MNLFLRLQTSLADAYDLERELTGGGMSRVFLARERALGRLVVIKVLAPEMSSGVLAERFRREISVAAQLRHPNIVPLLTAGEADGLLYFTMPFVEGETLRAHLKGEPLSVRESLRMLREIASALSYAHDHRVVHRDIKPENVLIENGNAVVTDFGVSKALASAGLNESQAGSGITTAGLALGTIAYMAPEQAAADPDTDHRADLYALGITAYEMLSGATPFAGRTPQKIVTAHFTERPAPLSTMRDDLPEALTELVARLLDKQPEDRPQSATEVIQAIDEITATLSSAERSGSGSRFIRGTTTKTRMSLRTKQLLVGALVVLGTAGAYASWRMSRGSENQTAMTARRIAPDAGSVAVLVFANTSGVPEDEHFTDGLTDELITLLGKVHGVKVAARTSVFALKGKQLGVRAIADTLGVATVLDGSVRRVGNRLRVTVQLVSAATGQALWSDSYDRQLIDVFAVQEEIARAIVGALNVRLTANEQIRLAKRPTDDLEAYELYLKGRSYYGSRARRDLDSALTYFQRATERDPRFALGYAGMADCFVVQSNFNYARSSEALERARIASDRAITLDSSLAEAHASRGFVLASRGSFASSEAAFHRALALNPSYALGHHYYSLLLTMLGRPAEAFEQNTQVLQLDPLSVPGAAFRGLLLIQQGDYAGARSRLQQNLALGSDYPLTFLWLGFIEIREGRSERAKPFFERAYKRIPAFPGVSAAMIYTDMRLGQRADAERLLSTVRAAATDEQSRMTLALTLAVADSLDSAFALLSRPRWDVPSLIELRTDPLLEKLRSDARYRQLLARSGLKQ